MSEDKTPYMDLYDERNDLRQQVATLQKDKETLQIDFNVMEAAARGHFQDVRKLQEDNETLNTDLKEAEGAVHNFCDKHSEDHIEGCCHCVIEKIEAEVEAQVDYIHKLQNENSDYLQGKKQAEAERDRAKASLQWLVRLKDSKDKLGKTKEYIEDKPHAWINARLVIESINHKEK